MKTTKEYYKTPGLYNFEAQILEIKESEKLQFKVVLDKTLFYPEGGGQPGDKGQINGIKVINTVIENETIYHILEKKPNLGSAIAEVDKEYRNHFVIQHSGQHLISAVLYKELEIETKSVHLGLNVTTIEVSRADITENEIDIIEDTTNKLIRENRSIIYHETNDEGLSKFNIRRESKYSGYIRVVEIENYDMVPCGGVHIPTLSKIGLIKIVGYEKIRGNIRFKCLIGDNAYDDYKQKNSITLKLNKMLSTKTEEIISGVETLQKNVSELKFQLKESAKAYSNVVTNNLLDENPGVAEFSNLSNEIFRTVAIELTSKLESPLLLLNRQVDKVNWILLDSMDETVDFSFFKNSLLPVIQGKGGGKSKIWQGSGENENLKEFKNKTNNFLAKYK